MFWIVTRISFKQITGDVYAFATMGETLILTAFCHRTLSMERVAASLDATTTAMGTAKLAGMAKQTTP